VKSTPESCFQSYAFASTHKVRIFGNQNLLNATEIEILVDRCASFIPSATTLVYGFRAGMSTATLFNFSTFYFNLPSYLSNYTFLDNLLVN